MGRKKPTFAKVDQKEVEKKQNNGGLSENTKARRRGVNKVFDEFQKINDRPTLKEVCEAKDKSGLEQDLQNFFEAYYVTMSKEDDENVTQEDIDNTVAEEENDKKSDTGDQEQNDKIDTESASDNFDAADYISDHFAAAADDKKNDDELDDNEVKLRPKGNTALGYKSQIKMLTLQYSGNEFDISNKTQFPNFDVSLISHSILRFFLKIFIQS